MDYYKCPFCKYKRNYEILEYELKITYARSGNDYITVISYHVKCFSCSKRARCTIQEFASCIISE